MTPLSGSLSLAASAVRPVARAAPERGAGRPGGTRSAARSCRARELVPSGSVASRVSERFAPLAAGVGGIERLGRPRRSAGVESRWADVASARQPRAIAPVGRRYFEAGAVRGAGDLRHVAMTPHAGLRASPLRGSPRSGISSRKVPQCLRSHQIGACRRAECRRLPASRWLYSTTPPANAENALTDPLLMRGPGQIGADPQNRLPARSAAGAKFSRATIT
jgi:hypothetical protein